MKNIAALVLSIGLFCCCSTLKNKDYAMYQPCVVLNTSSYKIYVPVRSLTKELKDSSDDIKAAIKYIKESNQHIEVNPTHIASEKEFFVVELLDTRMESLLKNRIPIFFNKETKEWEKKYKLKYVQTPFGGKTLYVINNQGEILFSIPISIG